MSKNDGFEPRIIGFLCNWCSYAGADLAGVSRIQYPPNIRIIRVMCSGRIDPAFVLEAFKDGADGVSGRWLPFALGLPLHQWKLQGDEKNEPAARGFLKTSGSSLNVCGWNGFQQAKETGGLLLLEAWWKTLRNSVQAR